MKYIKSKLHKLLHRSFSYVCVYMYVKKTKGNATKLNSGQWKSYRTFLHDFPYLPNSSDSERKSKTVKNDTPAAQRKMFTSMTMNMS